MVRNSSSCWVEREASSAMSARSASLARRAANSDIAGSIVRRTSNSCRTRVLRSSSVAESPLSRISGSRSATTGRLPRRSRYPDAVRPWMASRTDVRATPNCSHNCRSAGTALPGCNSPVRIASSSWSRISDEMVRRLTGANGVFTVCRPSRHCGSAPTQRGPFRCSPCRLLDVVWLSDHIPSRGRSAPRRCSVCDVSRRRGRRARPAPAAERGGPR